MRSLKSRALRASFERFSETDWRLDTAKAQPPSRVHRLPNRGGSTNTACIARCARECGERPWPEWPRRAPRPRTVGAGARARPPGGATFSFYQYVQWIAARAVAGGPAWEPRAIEILGDFPFMVTLDSADVWSRRHDFLLDASVARRPMPSARPGRNGACRRTTGTKRARTISSGFACALRRQVELYDGFRVDHLVGFYRTYVRPFDGRPPFFMPAEEREQTELGETVMRIMIDTGADVSVEDLGTVPDFVRESIARLGLPGYKVLRWEPARSDAVSAVVGGHDRNARHRAAGGLVGIADRRRSGPASDSTRRSTMTPSAIGLIELLYNAGSNLVLLPIQDVFGWRDRINLPATISDANWTYVLPWPSDTLTAQPEAVERANRLAGWSYQTGRWHPPLETDD